MYKRKLQALGFPSYGIFNASDDKQFQNIVVWLEDQKIRRYKIEEREALRDTDKDDWDKAWKQYLYDLDCPVSTEPKNEILDWLLGLAINFEFSEKTEDLAGQKVGSENLKSTVENNPLDNLDFAGEDFKTGVNTLADLLKIPRHVDHLVTLEGISNLVKERLEPEPLKSQSKLIREGTPIKFEELISGFDIEDKNLNYAASVLRYLFMNDLRQLQTNINECIVSLQSLTANPVTDTKMGKVGY